MSFFIPLSLSMFALGLATGIISTAFFFKTLKVYPVEYPANESHEASAAEVAGITRDD